MQYPFSIEVKLIQEDFIEVEMIENIIDTKQKKKESLKVYIIQSAVIALISAMLFFTSWVAKESLYLALFFWILFTANFAYQYFFGHRNELKMTIKHLIESNQNGNEFFSEEVGFVNFNEKDIELLTNEQRRYFDYELINSIKITKRLYIFVMKNTKEKSLRGFSYMIIPKRDLDHVQKEKLQKICEEIKIEYSLEEWIGTTIFD